MIDMSKYELELTKILHKNGFFAKRGAGSTEIDVFAMYKSVPFTIEVKSSKKEKVYLSSDRLQTQLDYYRKHKEKYNENTFYMLRYKTRKNVDHRWEVHNLDMNLTPQGNEYIVYNEGIPIDIFIDEVKRRIDRSKESDVLKWYGCENFDNFLENLKGEYYG